MWEYELYDGYGDDICLVLAIEYDDMTCWQDG